MTERSSINYSEIQNANEIQDTRNSRVKSWAISLIRIILFILSSMIFLLEWPKLYICSLIIGLLPLNSTIRRKSLELFKTYTHYIIWFITYCLFPNPHYVVYDRSILNSKRNLIISNHLTNFDWILISKYMHDLSLFNYTYIVLKSSIKRIPILGKLIEFINYLFIERKIDRINNFPTKELNLDALLNRVEKIKEEDRYSILIFPEGTFLNMVCHQNDQNVFINENNKFKKLFTRVLIPKTKGFEAILDGVEDSVEGIIDVTIFTNPPNHLNTANDFSVSNLLLSNNRNLNMHLLVKYIPKNKLSNDFLISEFSKKNDLLENYATLHPNGFRNIVEFENFLKENQPDYCNNTYVSHSSHFNSFKGVVIILMSALISGFGIYYGYYFIHNIIELLVSALYKVYLHLFASQLEDLIY